MNFNSYMNLLLAERRRVSVSDMSIYQMQRMDNGSRCCIHLRTMRSTMLKSTDNSKKSLFIRESQVI